MLKWHSENEWNKIENPEEMRLPKQNTTQNKCTVPVVDTNKTSNNTSNMQGNSVSEKHNHESMSGTNSARKTHPHMGTHYTAVRFPMD